MSEKPAAKFSELGPLHDLLLKACPPDRKGKRSIMILADKLGMTYQGVYRWIAAGRIPANRVLDIVNVSGGKVTRSKLLPFVL